MRFAAALIAGTLGLSAAIAGDVPVLSVPEVIAQHEALNGKIIRVRGWILKECYRLGCELSATPSARTPWLELGGYPAFDIALEKASATGREIVVEGRVKRDCFDHSKDVPPPENMTMCFDRGAELAEPKLINVLSSQDK